MLRPRIIPCLLVHDGGLVKTVGFGNPKYVGDPINAVRIFNEKEVDELMVLDIDASVRVREPNYGLIEHLAAECRMPLCYGGGVKTRKQVERIVGLGVEKVAISSVLFERPEIIAEAAQSVGGQSIVAVLDVRRTVHGRYEVCTHNGTRATGQDPVEFAHRIQTLGAGEIVINSIDRDGQMKGYDFELIRAVRAVVTIPMTCLGGAGSLSDIQVLIAEHRAIGAAAGSLFVFKGVYRAVLINYPNSTTKNSAIRAALQAQA
jgi:cyclase